MPRRRDAAEKPPASTTATKADIDSNRSMDASAFGIFPHFGKIHPVITGYSAKVE
jgi:hypothetical protein